MKPISCCITRYGLSKKVGGWDTYGDSGTDDWIGDHNNHLTTASCALNALAMELFGCKSGDILRIVIDLQREQFRRVDDTAPEIDKPRVDLFYPWCDDPTLPDTALISVYPQ